MPFATYNLAVCIALFDGSSYFHIKEKLINGLPYSPKN